MTGHFLAARGGNRPHAGCAGILAGCRRGWPGFAGLAALSLLAACEPPALEEPVPEFDPQTVAAAVLEVLDMQVEAWNEGDIDGFMAGYLNSDELRFASGNEIQRGWRQTRRRYHERYPDRAAMGSLAFEDLDVRVLSEHAAQVFGRFRLTRESDELTGLFTLLLERHGDRWFIVADHTSQ